MTKTASILTAAARLALRAAGDVEPNPMVGALLVRDGVILGMGHHRRFGGLHAEREALADCRGRGNDPRGSIAFVTLEPCCHHGKQPPCTEALIEAGVARVVYARPDPHELSCGGAEVLRRAGIPCELSEESPLATRLSDPFVKRVTTGLPWVIAKWAQTADGRLVTRPGEARWISNGLSLKRVHRLRARVDAIVTGIGTVVADDPLLHARGVRRVRRVARRVVLTDGRGLPPASRLARGEGVGEVLVMPGAAGNADLREVLRLLVDEHHATNVMLECGPTLLASFAAGGLIDEAYVYTAPGTGGPSEVVGPARAWVAGLSLVRAKVLAGDTEWWFRR